MIIASFINNSHVVLLSYYS